MSSLAAAKADNFYFPKDFDPETHRTLNRYHGQHALRGRALSDGGLVVRFEVPFPLACARCGESIGKGVRFNAEKRQAGTYHSTKVWRFEMRHHCGSVIVVQTDPANADYVVLSGARRRAAPGRAELGAPEDEEDEDEDEAAAEEEGDERGAGGGGGRRRAAALARALREEEERLLGPADAVPRDHAVGRDKQDVAAAAGATAAEAAAAGGGAMAALERSAAAARRREERRSRLEALEDMTEVRHASGAGLALNRALRDRMRAARDEERSLEARRRRMGVAEGVRLLPAARADGEAAARAMAEAAAAAQQQQQRQRQEAEGQEAQRRRILSEPIFARAAGAGGRAGVEAALAAAAAAAAAGKNKRPRPEASAAAAAAPPAAAVAGKPKSSSSSSCAVAAWAPPLARRRR